jgi:hypothetical protein
VSGRTAGRLLDATLQVVWDGWPRALSLREGDVEIGSLVRGSERTTLEVDGTEWWVEIEGFRMVRGMVTDPERTPLLLFAGQVDWGAALTRGGRTLTIDIKQRWRAFHMLPGSVTDQAGRTLLETLPFREAGSTGWSVRTGQDDPDDVAATLALWGTLVLARNRTPWLRFTTAGLRPSRIEDELEALRSRLG